MGVIDDKKILFFWITHFFLFGEIENVGKVEKAHRGDNLICPNSQSDKDEQFSQKFLSFYLFMYPLFKPDRRGDFLIPWQDLLILINCNPSLHHDLFENQCIARSKTVIRYFEILVALIDKLSQLITGKRYFENYPICVLSTR